MVCRGVLRLKTRHLTHNDERESSAMFAAQLVRVVCPVRGALEPHGRTLTTEHARANGRGDAIDVVRLDA